MKRLAPLCLILMALPLAAFARSWQVDAARSTLGFSGSFQGGAFHGVFKHFTADIRFDPADLAHARFDVTVTLASVDTQASERDDTLKGADFFNVDKTPLAHFVAASFDRDATGQVTAHGHLTLRNVTQPVTLSVHFEADATGATLSVDTVLERLDFGLGSSNDWADISKRIPVHAQLALK